MEISDLAKIEITEEMIAEARDDQGFHNRVSVGAKTRADYDERDLVGSLGHQIVEQYFEFHKLPTDRYKSFRKERRIDRGDDMDIFFNDDAIDVKATHGTLDEQYFFNKGFLVYDAQLKDPKFELISHFIFVQVDLQHKVGHIYGIVLKDTFLNKAKPVQLKHANHEIKAYQLVPLHVYFYNKHL